MKCEVASAQADLYRATARSDGETLVKSEVWCRKPVWKMLVGRERNHEKTWTSVLDSLHESEPHRGGNREETLLHSWPAMETGLIVSRVIDQSSVRAVDRPHREKMQKLLTLNNARAGGDRGRHPTSTHRRSFMTDLKFTVCTQCSLVGSKSWANKKYFFKIINNNK